MSDDPQGNYTPPGGTTAVDGQTALASQHNLFVQDASAALSRRLFADGRKAWTGNQNANGRRVTGAADAVDDHDYVTLAQMQDAIAAIKGVPTGSLFTMTGMQIPDGGYVIANGQSLSRTDYADLWAYAQDSENLASTEEEKTVGQYGPGDGSTTFTLPNLYADNGYFIRPISDGRGLGTVQADTFKAHKHNVTDPGHHHTYRSRATNTGGTLSGGGPYIPIDTFDTSTATTGITIQNTGDSETRPKNIAYPVLIKT